MCWVYSLIIPNSIIILLTSLILSLSCGDTCIAGTCQNNVQQGVEMKITFFSTQTHTHTLAHFASSFVVPCAVMLMSTMIKISTCAHNKDVLSNGDLNAPVCVHAVQSNSWGWNLRERTAAQPTSCHASSSNVGHILFVFSVVVSVYKNTRCKIDEVFI